MSHAESPAPVRAPFFSRGTMALTALMAVGLLVYGYRLLFGLGSVTNLTDQYPWGIWIAIDVASGVALAAGGFTTAAIAHIFHRHKYHVVVRPALLTALLGYTFVVIGLLADLGRYYVVWHPMLPSMWQGNSVLFEVGMCVMIYLTVLYIEFLPIVVERFKDRVNLPGALARFSEPLNRLLKFAEGALDKTLSLFIIAGVVLSCLHQSSLGTLMVIAPTKMHPLWASPISPALFLMSAIAVGFPMVIFESLWASRSFRLRPEMDVLSSLARFTPLLLGLYLAVRIGDLSVREVWSHAFKMDARALLFWVEVLVLGALPMVLLSLQRVRQSPRGLFLSACLVIGSVVLNRINVFLVAYQPPYADKPYVPTLWEVLLTVGLISMLILVYRVIVMVFPVISIPHAVPATRTVEQGS